MRVCVIFFVAVFCINAPGYAWQDTVNLDDQVALPSDEGAIVEGRRLFQRHCSVCHAVTHEVIGPALASIPQKRPRPWLLRFIKNSQEVIQSGDEYAVELYENYNRQIMPAFEFLSDDEILNVLAYIHAESTPDLAGVQTIETQDRNETKETRAQPGGNFERSHKDGSYELEEGVPILVGIMHVITGISLVILVVLSIRIFKSVR